METLARLAAEASVEATTQFMTELQGANDLGHAMYNWSRKLKPTHPLIVSLPCASIVSHTPCEKPGTKVCTGCRLVSYCSRECQSAHWKRHKLHCKDDLLSSRWNPIWKARGYKPSFSPDNDLARDNFKLSVTSPPCLPIESNFQR
ncbi:hypothetical protein FA13DRAFT_1741056 [Coprinellus micaceus]|uniref:MYND-type domain-containing protein n=1 Tax=Coprinellus micaceus TaxID=71717 RepID=A0A4Y7SKL3_COPMI|nr:hypothetical protein FA13DRAFT_1741056 [Coprinellus micaceus]